MFVAIFRLLVIEILSEFVSKMNEWQFFLLLSTYRSINIQLII